MTKFRLTACLFALALVTSGSVGTAAEYTFGSFEDLQFVSQWFPTSFNVTQSFGQIHNGPTPDNGTGPNGGATPTAYPQKPGGNANDYGNWDRSNFNGPNDNPDVNTGWGDWKFNNLNTNPATFSLSTTGATHGSNAIKVVPAVFGTDNYSQHLSFKIQNRQADGAGDTTNAPAIRDEIFDNFQNMRYFAFDVTFNSADWTGSTDGFVQISTYYNQGGDNTTQALVDRGGFHNIGTFVENTADPATALLRAPTHDTGNPNNPGLWDPGNYPGIHTRTMYWDFSSWEQENTGQPGVPSGVFYDFHQFTQDPNIISGTNGWLEFMIATAYSENYTNGAFYFDNWRFTDELPQPTGDADFNDDGDVNADDIDILWAIVRNTGTDPNGNDTADLNNDGFANENDVDHMLANLLDAGTNRLYGDADLDGGVGGLDFTAWRLRAGTGWANGDFDGDGGIGGLDFTLWRTRPSVYPSDVGPHSGLAAVPEPGTLVLLGLGLPALALVARRRKGSV